MPGNWFLCQRQLSNVETVCTDIDPKGRGIVCTNIILFRNLKCHALVQLEILGFLCEDLLPCGDIVSHYCAFVLQMSGSRMKVAGRFKPCVHMGCFDLEVFVEMNMRSRKASIQIPCVSCWSFVVV